MTKREKIIETLGDLMLNKEIARKVDVMVKINTREDVDATYDYYHKNYYNTDVNEQCFIRLMWNTL